MQDQHTLALQQADEARTDFAVIESNLEFTAGQLACVSRPGDLANTALGIIIATAGLVVLWAEARGRL